MVIIARSRDDNGCWTIREGPNGLEVLVRKPSEPGRIIKLVGAQAQSAQNAFLEAAAKVEAAGGKVTLGTARPRIDKPLPASTLLNANLTPQQPGQDAALETLRGSLRAAADEINRLGAQVEEIDSAEAARRGYEQSLTIAVSPDGRSVVVVADKFGGSSLTQEVADVVVREEVIHLAWLAAMRAEHQRTGMGVPFDQWMQTELNGWINELLTTKQGAQALVDAANTYYQPAVPFESALAALDALEGAEAGLMLELARQLIQLRESGKITESVIAKAIQKIRQWFTAALMRLRAVAADVGSVSPTLNAAIEETERILAGAAVVPPQANPNGGDKTRCPARRCGTA